MPDESLLEAVEVEPELAPAARNIVATCLAAGPADRAVLIADEGTAALAAAVLAAFRGASAPCRVWVLERLGPRPLPGLPASLARDLAEATVSAMMVRPEPGELAFRAAVVEAAARGGLRHAHMPGIDREAMTTAMRADFGAIARLHERLVPRLEAASLVTVRSPAGTDLEVRLERGLRWLRKDGVIKPGEPQNLPAGLLQTAPDGADGVYVVDGAMGDWFGSRYPDLQAHPCHVELAGGRVRDARCDHGALARQLLVYVRSNPNGDRVGELGLGTNLALDRCTGKILLDQCVPGALVTLGRSAGLGATAGAWSSRTHLPLVGRDCDVLLDGEPIVLRGKFVEDLVS